MAGFSEQVVLFRVIPNSSINRDGPCRTLMNIEASGNHLPSALFPKINWPPCYARGRIQDIVIQAGSYSFYFI